MTAEVVEGFSIPTPLINAPRCCAARLVRSKFLVPSLDYACFLAAIESLVQTDQLSVLR